MSSSGQEEKVEVKNEVSPCWVHGFYPLGAGIFIRRFE